MNAPPLTTALLPLLAMTALMAPAARAQYQIGSYLTYDPDTVRLYGYSYTELPWNDGFVALYVEATIGCCNLAYADSGQPVVATIVYTPASFSAQVHGAGTYYIDGYHYYYDVSGWVPNYIGETEYDLPVQPVPLGESFNSVSGDTHSATFFLNLTPSGTAFDGGTVYEDFSGFSDGCYSALPTGPRLTGPSQGSLDIGYYGSYSDTVSAGDDNWSNYYGQAVAEGLIGSCGWQVYQTMSYSGVNYAYNTNGQTISLNGQSASLKTYRGSHSYTSF